MDGKKRNDRKCKKNKKKENEIHTNKQKNRVISMSEESGNE